MWARKLFRLLHLGLLSLSVLLNCFIYNKGKDAQIAILALALVASAMWLGFSIIVLKVGLFGDGSNSNDYPDKQKKRDHRRLFFSSVSLAGTTIFFGVAFNDFGNDTLFRTMSILSGSFHVFAEFVDKAYEILHDILDKTSNASNTSNASAQFGPPEVLY